MSAWALSVLWVLFAPGGLAGFACPPGQVVIGFDDAEAPICATLDAVRRAAGPSEPAKQSAEELETMIRPDGENRFVLAGTDVKALLDPAKLAGQCRVFPSYKNGKPQGFKLFGLRETSVLHAMGLRNGDIVLAVNGHQLDSPTKALNLYRELKGETQIKVKIERRGEQIGITYVLPQE